MKELIAKVNNYLEESGWKPLSDSIFYVGIKKEMKLRDRGTKDMHCIAFLAPTEYENIICFVYADAKTNELECLITPHIYERIR